MEYIFVFIKDNFSLSLDLHINDVLYVGLYCYIVGFIIIALISLFMLNAITIAIHLNTF